MKHAHPSGYEWMKWFGGGKAPSFSVDLAACWVNNPRDMIEIQNAMWWYRDSWNNQLVPYPDATGRRYWGWNEIPLNIGVANNPVYWDAVVVKLPSAICGGGTADTVKCLTPDAQNHLEQNLQWYVNEKHLIPGVAHLKFRPGSYVVFMKEWWNKDFYSWYRGFYCEPWESPQKRLQIVYTPRSGGDVTGNCYIDYVDPAPPHSVHGCQVCLRDGAGKCYHDRWPGGPDDKCSSEDNRQDCEDNDHGVWCGKGDQSNFAIV